MVVALPGAVLPGGFEISARQTYGRTSDGMICSARELDLGDDHNGIVVLAAGSADVGRAASELLSFGEEVLDIAVTLIAAMPSRSVALHVRPRLPINCPSPTKRLSLRICPRPSQMQSRGGGFEDPHACDVFTLRTIVDVDPGAQTPLWMSQRLLAAGMRPVSLIVDITNYVMLETGQPSTRSMPIGCPAISSHGGRARANNSKLSTTWFATWTLRIW